MLASSKTTPRSWRPHLTNLSPDTNIYPRTNSPPVKQSTSQPPTIWQTGKLNWSHKLRQRQYASSVSQQQQSFVPRSALQLPRINLLRFAGDLSTWESFRDQFKALIIDNSDLVNVNRLQYLHSCLKDDAFGIVRNLSLTDANFQIA